MRTNLVDIEDAKGRLASGEQPYAFVLNNDVTIAGPACGYGADYLLHLREDGRYAESIEEASQIAYATGAIITAIWFVKR
jgi:hypothetical protein